MSRTWWWVLLLAALAAVGIWIVPWRAPAQTVGRAGAGQEAAGRRFAQQYCAECHMISPTASKGWTDAPTFEAIANRQGETAEKLAAFIEKPHMHMLNTGRPPDEAREIAGYIMSQRKR